MRNYFKGALKILVAYLTSLLIFGIFLITVVNFAKENLTTWLIGYSFVIFLLLALMVYGDMKSLAIKEKRPQYELNPYPVKGLIYGLMGFSPFILLQLVYPFIRFDGFVADRIKSLVLSTLLGPLYGFIKLGGKSVLAYIAASAIVPLIAMLGYMAGFYGIELIKKKHTQKPKDTNSKK